MGRISMFPEPGGKAANAARAPFWVRAYLTTAGMKKFERARRRLEKLWTKVTGRQTAGAGDADTIEFLLRGEKASAAYFRKFKR